MKRLWLILPLLLIAAGSGLYLKSRGRRPSARAVVSFSESYAGSASCASCHPKETGMWKNSHHARAQRPISKELDEAAFVPSRTIPHGSQVSTTHVKDDQFTLTTIGGDGQSHDYVPLGVIGVDPLWQYLISLPGGRVQVSELAFDPAKKEWFDVYGEEDRRPWEWGHWSNRGMNWNSMCATCHTTGYEKNYDASTDGYKSSWHELGVGCEACHGPMGAHVQWQTQFRGKPDDPTLKYFDRDQYFHVCASCHSRRQELTGQFKPGDDYFDHFEPALPDESDVFYPDGQVRDEDFEFSAFLLSYMQGQGVHCFNCHSSHSGKLYFPGNELCLQCHAQGVTNKIPIDVAEHSHHKVGTAGSSCTDCHMPITAYMQRHRRHDHGLPIPDPMMTKDYGIPNACNRCHADKSTDWALTQVEQWYGERMNRPTRVRAKLMARAKKGDTSVVPELVAWLDQEKNPTWRAVGLKFLETLGQKSKPAHIALIHSAAEKWIGDEDPQVQAASIDIAQYSPNNAAKIAEKLDNPSRLVRLRAAWAMRANLNMDSLAGRDLDRMLTVGGDQQVAVFQRGNLLRDRGQVQDSLAWFAKAASWDRGTAVIHYQYAVALDDAGRPQEAIAALEQALKIEPKNALYLYSMGLMLGELNQLPAARDALRSAVAIDASEPRYWYNLAIIELKLNDQEEALTSVSRAEQLDATNVEYVYLRALILHGLQRDDQARTAIQRALQIDPNHGPSKELSRGLN